MPPKPNIIKAQLASLPGYNLNERRQYPPHVHTGTSKVPIFYPSLEEMKDFAAYISQIEAKGGHVSSGIVKIIPPDDFNPRPSRSNYDDVLNCEILKPVMEKVYGSDGVYRKINTRLTQKSLSVLNFISQASPTPSDIPNLEGEEIEDRLIADIIMPKAALYGADSPGSLFDENVKEFNLQKLGTIMDESEEQIPGVHSPYLYVGTYHSSFAWHPEDMDLYSINYLHFGAPKYWFAIPPEAADRFEKILDQLYPDWKEKCPAFYRHKECIVTPEVLRKYGIPFSTMIQYPREFIVTFPRGYHHGFNLGLNFAEAVNFATDRWIDFGCRASLCLCHNVFIQIEPFMRYSRSYEYKAWETQMKDFVKKEKRSDVLAEVRNWRKLKPAIWSSSAPNFEAEKEENRRRSHRYPHCSVCTMFVSKVDRFEVTELPMRSDRFVRNRLFTKQNPDDCHLSDEDPAVDALAKCSSCQVVVHLSCYGGATTEEDWLCFRCIDRTNVELTFCSLCEERGGALHPSYYGMDDDQLVHVNCAILHRKTWFSEELPPIFAERYPALQHLPRQNLYDHLAMKYIFAQPKMIDQWPRRCDVCKIFSTELVHCKKCFDIRNPFPTTVHVTCAVQAGYSFELAPYPLCIKMTCDKTHIS